MAAIDHFAYAPSAYPLDGVLAAISRNVNAVKRRVRGFIAYRQTLNSLSSLSPRQLEDIGLEGANIELLARDMSKRNLM